MIDDAVLQIVAAELHTKRCNSNHRIFVRKRTSGASQRQAWQTGGDDGSVKRAPEAVMGAGFQAQLLQGHRHRHGLNLGRPGKTPRSLTLERTFSAGYDVDNLPIRSLNYLQTLAGEPEVSIDSCRRKHFGDLDLVNEHCESLVELWWDYSWEVWHC